MCIYMTMFMILAYVNPNEASHEHIQFKVNPEVAIHIIIFNRTSNKIPYQFAPP